MVGSCKHGKRISGFNKSRKFLNWLKYSAFHRRPFTKKSVVFFSSISSTFTGHNCFLLYLTAQADTGTTHPAWHLWFSGISHTVKPQKSEDLFYTTAEARHHTYYMHSVVNKVLARNGMMASSFIPHVSFRISSSIHKLTLRRRTTYIYVALWRSLTLRRLMLYICIWSTHSWCF